MKILPVGTTIRYLNGQRDVVGKLATIMGVYYGNVNYRVSVTGVNWCTSTPISGLREGHFELVSIGGISEGYKSLEEA